MHPKSISSLSLTADGKGRSIDNIVIKRFWCSLKYEEIYLNDYKSMSELRYSIDFLQNSYMPQSDKKGYRSYARSLLFTLHFLYYS